MKNKVLPVLQKMDAPKANDLKINHLDYPSLYVQNLALYNNNPCHTLFLANHNYPFHCQAISQLKIEKDALDFHHFKFNVSAFGIQKKCAKDIMEIFEVGHLNYFKELLKNGTKVCLFNSTIKLDSSKPQPAPDIIIDFSKSHYKSLQKFGHSVISYDQKTSGNFNESENKLLNISVDSYHTALDSYFQKFENYNVSQKDLAKFIHKLKLSCLNSEEHLETWVSHLYLFPENSPMPPLRSNFHFNPNYLSEKSLLEYNTANYKYMEIINSYFT